MLRSTPKRGESAAPFEEIDEKEKRPNEKPLMIFSFDISHYSPTVQFLILTAGLLLFMCLYGYFQELVVYGWFDRKLSLFSTFLHFLGCSVFAQMQRRVSKAMHHSHHSQTHGAVLSMGTAPPRVAIGYYFLLVFLKTATQGLTNLSMTQINYPAKVLFKSANPIITMLIGIVWFKKKYPLRDYGVVVLLVVGLYLFISSDANDSPEGTRTGILLVTVAMFGGAAVPMVQEHCMLTYNATVEDLLYHCYLGSTLMAFVCAVAAGEMQTGVTFLIQSGSMSTWISFTLFCSAGFLGSNFSTALTLRFGSLVNGITNTARKAVTLFLSFVLFPERNTFTRHHLLGAAVFFSGLLLRTLFKDRVIHGSLEPHSDKHVGIQGISQDGETVFTSRFSKSADDLVLDNMGVQDAEEDLESAGEEGLYIENKIAAAKGRNGAAGVCESV